MRRALIGTALFIAAASVARADVIEVESFHLGGFYALDETGMPLIPDNDMTFQNYFMGRTTVSGFTTTERRTFFAFDLSSVLIPEGEMVTSVEFELMLPFAGILANFTDGVEEVVFTSTSIEYPAFADPLMSGLGPDEIFDSMGTGDFYSSVGFDEMTPDGEIVMDMSEAATSDMLMSIESGSPFVITGFLETYDPDPDALFEFVFGLTDVVTGGGPTGFPVPKIVITTAPIPAPSGLCLIALAGAGICRRSR
jgi:hypothetical protein